MSQRNTIPSPSDFQRARITNLFAVFHHHVHVLQHTIVNGNLKEVDYVLSSKGSQDRYLAERRKRNAIAAFVF